MSSRLLLRGYLVPDGTVDLVSPLKGTYVVLNGGTSPFTNAHFRVRPQNYALDILGVNSIGARASLMGSGRVLENYVIYGASIRSPCDGRIAVVVNNLPDHSPPARDTENPDRSAPLAHPKAFTMGQTEYLLAMAAKI